MERNDRVVMSQFLNEPHNKPAWTTPKLTVLVNLDDAENGKLGFSAETNMLPGATSFELGPAS